MMAEPKLSQHVLAAALKDNSTTREERRTRNQSLGLHASREQAPKMGDSRFGDVRTEG